MTGTVWRPTRGPPTPVTASGTARTRRPPAGAPTGAGRAGAAGPAPPDLLARGGDVRRAARRPRTGGVVDPVELVLPAGSRYTPDLPLRWLPTRRWRTGRRCSSPPSSSPRTPAGSAAGPPGGFLTTPITNGMGAGDTLERAVAHGIGELLQRDGDTVSFRALEEGVLVDGVAETTRDGGRLGRAGGRGPGTPGQARQHRVRRRRARRRPRRRPRGGADGRHGRGGGRRARRRGGGPQGVAGTGQFPRAARVRLRAAGPGADPVAALLGGRGTCAAAGVRTPGAGGDGGLDAPLGGRAVPARGAAPAGHLPRRAGGAAHRPGPGTGRRADGAAAAAGRLRRPRARRRGRDVPRPRPRREGARAGAGGGDAVLPPHRRAGAAAAAGPRVPPRRARASRPGRAGRSC